MGTDDLFKKRRKDIDRKESKIKEIGRAHV